ncbi:hypothetical retrotransposon [Pelobates cultripes]|uniref:Hypothetical retrotransposon, partial n=1 Tax=Pelobates cultripes TaxID=61616 RepID=A0AAD1W9N1_PELCU|nr:hypothetical retrotransposon [Pelobates cultripes]
MDYAKLKRQMLQEILAAQGRAAGTQPKANLIATLMEDGLQSGGAVAPQLEVEKDDFDNEMACLFAYYLGSPSQEIMARTISEVQTYILAANVFRAVSADGLRDYDLVKKVLLARYAVTPNAYRRKFLGRQDFHAEWDCHLTRVAKNWMNSQDTKSPKAILKLFLLEQFYNGLSTEVHEWVRDYPHRINCSSSNRVRHGWRRSSLSGSGDCHIA